jgi:hypothetical protein
LCPFVNSGSPLSDATGIENDPVGVRRSQRERSTVKETEDEEIENLWRFRQTLEELRKLLDDFEKLLDKEFRRRGIGGKKRRTK